MAPIVIALHSLNWLEDGNTFTSPNGPLRIEIWNTLFLGKPKWYLLAPPLELASGRTAEEMQAALSRCM